MDQTPFTEIEQAMAQQGPEAAINQLATQLRDRKDWHNLFDARMLQKKQSLGLPLARPASLQDVPEEQRKDVEQAYVAAAREAGEGFLSEGKLTEAWMYLKAIREPAKVAEALEQMGDEIEDYDELDRVTRIALFEGVHPEKGIRLMLTGHGTCSTITALDQVFAQLTQEQRAACAKIMVRTLHEELTETVRRHVEQRMPMVPPGESLGALIRGRDWLFENGNYHTDVSHLSSIVRFARMIEPPAEELTLALELCEYGAKLDPQLQYGGEAPFNDYYPAHIQFFNILLDRQREAGLQYFRTQLEREPDEQDKPLLAYVLVDLLVRCEKLDEAIEVGSQYLTNLSEDVNISFDELCVKAGRLDVLKQVRAEQKDLVGFTAAVIRQAHAEAQPLS